MHGLMVFQPHGVKGVNTMIKVTVNEQTIWVNPEHVVSVGSDVDGDSYIVASNGKMTYVDETVEEILSKMGVDTKGTNV